MTTQPQSVTDAALGVLTTADARQKAEAARRVAAAFLADELGPAIMRPVPDRPARPETPLLARPGDVPRRKITEHPRGRIALLHALAHIELNAIDLAFDILARFAISDPAPPSDFISDWISVGDDEARHFLMLADRLEEMDSHYGALSAHDGLWEASQDTSHDLLARLAIVPLVLEARGLDVTPAMINKLKAAKDEASAACLQIIHDDEIGHVAIGMRWFQWLSATRRLPPRETWQHLVSTHFKGQLKPPFNTVSRAAANLPETYYMDMENPRSGTGG